MYVRLIAMGLYTLRLVVFLRAANSRTKAVSSVELTETTR